MPGSTSQDRPGTATDTSPRNTDQTTQPVVRPPPRSSSPAKRPASDMEDAGKEQMDIDPSPTIIGDAEQGSGNDSPQATKLLPAMSHATAEEQKPPRAHSAEMSDDRSSSVTNGMSAASSDTASVSNQESTATSVSTASCAQPSSPIPGNSTANVADDHYCGSSSLPSIDEQVTQVMMIHQKQLTDGQEGYLLSAKWLERVMARTTDNLKHPENFEKSALDGEIGPVDNSDLVDEGLVDDDLEDEHGDDFIPLKRGLQINRDFEVLPEEAWHLILEWYGQKKGTPTIRRYTHNTAPPGAMENIQYELNPPIFTIRKLQNHSAGMNAQSLQDNQKLSPRIVASRGELFQKFLKNAKAAAGIDMKTKVQVWRVLSAGQTDQPQESEAGPSGILTPVSSRGASPNPLAASQRLPLLIDIASFNSLSDGVHREMVTGKDETANDKYNGHLNLQTVGLAEDQVLILEEQIGGPGGGEYVSDTTRKVSIKNGTILKSSAGKPQNKSFQGSSDSGRSSPAPSGPVTRGRTRRDGRTKGTVGLTNLGNTCYMNSALQCIRSVEELTLYFLHEHYKKDLNPSNPLGHNGTIAKSYAGLLGAIYDDNALSSFPPKNFKYALGRAQPLFSGYGQQDSQEFLSFLVDGLHEDLNRIFKKPYVENPESDDKTVNDPEAIRALGEKFRENHHARNDSVAMDLFNGFYKNTMVCPICDKVSITFDPFSLLTLQLPIEQTWQHTITFAPLYSAPFQIDVDIDKNGTIYSLKEYIASRVPGVKASHIMGAEIYSHKFYRTLEDSKTIAESNIQARDDIVMYELDAAPTNFPPPKKKHNKIRSMVSWNNASSEEDIPDSESPLADRMVVPIFHRAQSHSTYSNSRSLKLWPSYILVTREEARDYDSILRKVLAKVSTMTSRPILTEMNSNYESFEDSRNGSDTVLTTDEDASPNIDPRIQDRSVEGEDMVEVTMAEPIEGTVDELMGDPNDTNDSERIPEVLQPGAFIPPELRQLFQLKHTKANKEMVPTGWSTIDQSKDYPLIESRIRVPPSRRSSMQSTEENFQPSSSEEADDTIAFSVTTTQESFTLAEESSEEELPPADHFTRGGRQKNSRKNKHGKNKKATTYSKKGKGRFIDQPIYPIEEPEADEDPALIRLGEAIILDWNSQAFESLFEGMDPEDPRGMDTWKNMDTLPDPVLQEKKARRAARKKSGITLQECFAETSKGEILSEENAWYCNRCKELRRASKTLEIWTLPDILVVHLKRFSANRGFRDKIDVLVDFPIEGLDLSQRVGLPEGKEMIYDLFAVDNHYGGLGGGHYTAFAQNFFDKRWYEYNDSSVSQRNPKSVVTSAAYLLFYRRRSSTPLGPPYLQKIVEAAYAPESESVPESQSNSRQASRSPAGNGRRLDDLSRNGSSSASAAAAAGPLRGGGSDSGAGAARGARSARGASAMEDQDEETTDVETEAYELEAQNPPPYDEGYGGDDDAFGGGSAYGPHVMGHYANPVWNFSAVGAANLVRDEEDEVGYDGDGDAASNAPALGDDDLNDRIMQDFGDDYVGPHQVSRAGSAASNEEVPDLLEEGPEVRMIESTETGDDEGEVADVRLEDVDVEAVVGGEGELGEHDKMD
ncbi:UCH-domain-containing protein [Lepidopterella palustris CBS 459.81]|uniref:ubiquitinyl hydrolase 1 n=1 Tax=Lepidopterella palustris CBS 459.81 TaxID=1314670 RepID=A0A8E2E6S8_9PEZI|nr:UCH-domain-containing protein [Lepidopterella palustris CBS 459.81]